MSAYYLALRGWLELGEGEAVVRSLSALAGVGAVVVLTVVAWRLYGRFVGVAAGTLLAANAFFVRYAQEARGYTLALLAATLATALYLRVVERRGRVAWAAYVLCSALAVYAHFYAAFVVVAHVLVLPLVAPDARRRVLGAAAATALAAVPLALFVAFRDEGQTEGIPGASPYRVASALGALAGGTLPLLALYGALAAVALVAAWRGRSGLDRRTRFGVALALAWLVAPVLGGILISTVKPLFLARYLLVGLPGLVLLVALGLRALPARAAAGAAALAAVFSSLALAGWYAGEEKEGLDFRAGAAFLADEMRPGDGAVFYRPSRRLPVEYYLRRVGRIAEAPAPIFPDAPWGSFDLVHDYASVRPAGGSWSEVVGSASRSHPRVWFVVGRRELVPTESAAAERALRERYGNRTSRSFGDLRVTLYSAPRGGQ